jgi:hypothetical protein
MSSESVSIERADSVNAACSPGPSRTYGAIAPPIRRPMLDGKRTLRLRMSAKGDFLLVYPYFFPNRVRWHELGYVPHRSRAHEGVGTGAVALVSKPIVPTSVLWLLRDGPRSRLGPDATGPARRRPILAGVLPVWDPPYKPTDRCSKPVPTSSCTSRARASNRGRSRDPASTRAKRGRDREEPKRAAGLGWAVRAGAAGRAARPPRCRAR